MQMFEGFREKGWNTYYEGHAHPVTFDLRLVLLAFAGVVIASTLIMIVIGTRGKEKWSTFFRLMLNLHPGVVILVTISGRCWLIGHIDPSHMEYTAMTSHPVDAQIGVHVGLKGVNVTLAGFMNVTQEAGSVAYNEHFSFDKVNGLEVGLHRALHRGLPHPILYVMEYFAMDKGMLRWHRFIRAAGHFVYIMLWSSFAAWVVANIVLAFVVARGAVILLLSGSLMVGACALYHGLHPATSFIIPFEDTYLHFHYGWCFWMCGIFGVVTCLWALIIVLLDMWTPRYTSLTFLVESAHLSTDSQKSSPSSRRSSPLILDTPHQRRRSLISTFENLAFVSDKDSYDEPPRYSARLGDQNTPTHEDFPEGYRTGQEVLNDNDPVPAQDNDQGSTIDDDLCSTQIEGSFIDDTLSDHIGISGHRYGYRNHGNYGQCPSDSWDSESDIQSVQSAVQVHRSEIVVDLSRPKSPCMQQTSDVTSETNEKTSACTSSTRNETHEEFPPALRIEKHDSQGENMSINHQPNSEGTVSNNVPVLSIPNGVTAVIDLQQAGLVYPGNTTS